MKLFGRSFSGRAVRYIFFLVAVFQLMPLQNRNFCPPITIWEATKKKDAAPIPNATPE